MLAAACALLVSVVGCDRAPGPATSPRTPAGPAPPPPLPDRLTARLPQRTEIHLPEHRPSIVVAIGDIAGGAVSLVIDTSEGESLAEPRMVRMGDRVEFELDGHAYELTVIDLQNHQIGEDFAAFEIRRRQRSEGASTAPAP